jgi:hypothetical protein
MEVLKKDPKANAVAVQTAWTTAGRSGSISGSLVNKVRADMGLTGNLRKRRKAAGRPATVTVQTAVKRGPGRPPKVQTNGSSAAVPAVRRAVASDRDGALDRFESELDRLIYKAMDLGGLDEVEQLLRRCRRTLILSAR